MFPHYLILLTKEHYYRKERIRSTHYTLHTIVFF